MQAKRLSHIHAVSALQDRRAADGQRQETGPVWCRSARIQHTRCLSTRLAVKDRHGHGGALPRHVRAQHPGVQLRWGRTGAIEVFIDSHSRPRMWERRCSKRAARFHSIALCTSKTPRSFANVRASRWERALRSARFSVSSVADRKKAPRKTRAPARSSDEAKSAVTRCRSGRPAAVL